MDILNIESLDGWVMVSVGDVTKPISQKKPAEEETFKYIDIASIDRNKKIISNPKIICGKDAPSRARKLIFAGDTLVSLTRPNLNAVALVSEKYHGEIASTGFEVLRPEGVEPRYLYFLTRTNDFVNEISGRVQGALYPAAKSSDVKAYEFYLPPLNEQNRIANKLDELLAQVDTIKARIDAIPNILKRFRQSVLAAAVSGKLTEEWSEEKVIDFGKSMKLGQVFDIDSGLAFKKSQYSESGSRLLQIANVSYGVTRWEKKAFIPITLAKENEKYSLVIGDVVMALNRPITNGWLKIAKIVESDLPAILYQRVARLRLKNSSWSAKYFFLVMRSEQFKKQVESKLKGSDQPYINTSSLNELEISVPSVHGQKYIVEKVDQYFNAIEILEKYVKDAQTRINKLTQSILAKAFRGELVPQDPNDEPASELLERIQQEREAAEQLAQAAKRTTRKPKTKKAKA